MSSEYKHMVLNTAFYSLRDYFGCLKHIKVFGARRKELTVRILLLSVLMCFFAAGCNAKEYSALVGEIEHTGNIEETEKKVDEIAISLEEKVSTELLQDENVREAYRMYLQRSFFSDSFYSVTIYKDGTGLAIEHAISNEYDVPDNDERELTDKILSTEETEAFLDQIEKAGFWRITPDTELGCDGESVFLQGVREDEVREIFNWGITDDKVKEIQAAYGDVFMLW